MLAEMQSDTAAASCLNAVAHRLVDSSAAKEIRLTSDWAKSVTEKQGVYVIFAGNVLAYVGESGCIRKRMKDLLDSRHHQLRRNLGEALFSNRKGFRKADLAILLPCYLAILLSCYLAILLSCYLATE